MDILGRGDFDQDFSNINVFRTLNCEDDEFQTEPDCTLLAVQTKVKADGKAPIYTRITIDGKYTKISTGKNVNPASWDLNTKHRSAKKWK